MLYLLRSLCVFNFIDFTLSYNRSTLIVSIVCNHGVTIDQKYRFRYTQFPLLLGYNKTLNIKTVPRLRNIVQITYIMWQIMQPKKVFVLSSLKAKFLQRASFHIYPSYVWKNGKIHGTAPQQINCFQSNQYLAKTNRIHHYAVVTKQSSLG